MGAAQYHNDMILHVAGAEGFGEAIKSGKGFDIWQRN